ncbi:MBL fold metallo-hydrolase [Jatrophihabitans sp.]|uniref:MBL fold metallo-hydrolase n=1 Tax=Jatrophihabitans sp. TaxID=1932789 RepID=UPI0030C77392
MDDRHAWEQPGAFEVAPGVHRIPLPLPGDALHAVNVYAISDGDQVVMIDGGWAMSQSTELMRAGLAQIGYELSDVREFLVTHLHRDHYTQAVAVRRITGSEVSVGEGERATLTAIHNLTTHPDIARLTEAGASDVAAEMVSWTVSHAIPDRTDWEDPDHWLTNGVDLALQTRTLRVIATPGHTRGHVVFHDRQANALFAGDHVLPHITPSIGVELLRPSSPLRDYLTSLELVRGLPDAQLLPAHGPVTGSVHARIDELLTHHQNRLQTIADAVDAGADTGYAVARAIGWTRRGRKLDELDLFNQVLAINETVAHLIVLVERGWLVRTVLDGVAHFARS